jgi:hypothetical protein
MVLKRTLHLTSPHMHGEDVKLVQTTLKAKGYYRGTIDGQYGPLTAQAVYRAKYRVGYLKPDQVAGPPFLNLVSGKSKPSAAQRALALQRKRVDDAKKKKAAKKKNGLTPQQMLVQKALTQLGQTENPADSNRSKFSIWYGVVGPWCAMFVTWVFVQCRLGRSTFKQGSTYAWVPGVVGDARAGRNGLMLAHGPADGVLVCYEFSGDSLADHIGMAAEESTLQRLVPRELLVAKQHFGQLASGDFWSVEGNTGVGNDANGGEVQLRLRHRAQVQAFVKVAV